MSASTIATSANLEILEDYYQRWRANPAAVDTHWQAFFEGFDLASRHPGSTPGDVAQNRVTRLIQAYRDLGHHIAHINPLEDPPANHPQLELAFWDLTEADLDRIFDVSAIPGAAPMSLRVLIERLRNTYCGSIGFEYLHIQDIAVRRWLQQRIEPRQARPEMDLEQKRRILRNLHHAELFENFLQNRFFGQKRFSLEGAESLIPLLDRFVQMAPEHGVQEYVIGMAHRGRLNVLANVLRKPYDQIFAEFEDYFNDDFSDGDGDVKYHLGFSSTLIVRGAEIHLSLTPNPSHLESVNPVVIGRTRAKQELFGDRERKRGVPLLIHGDAAMPGQGQVAETFNLARLPGYTTGGTLHVVINNQIGFTTAPNDGRSTRYCTDVSKIIQAPIFHVNAEDPEAVVFAAQLALEFRQEFNSDVVIDLVCYRRHGHNEQDEPTFTNPLLYKKIKNRPSPSKVYTDRLIKAGELTEEESLQIDTEFKQKLDRVHEDLRNHPRRNRGMSRFEAPRWRGFSFKYSHGPVETGVPAEILRDVAAKLTQLPPGFQANPGVVRTVLDKQRDMLDKGEPVDWGTAELLAYGTLLREKVHVRMTGQDCCRGTFSHRHAVLVDFETGERHVRLNHISPDQARFDIYDSPLSEYAVLGFEFGYSLDNPNALVLWEAQFGDFANGAQVVIDQYITSSESKWQRSSGLVLLLPHGYEGQGPEHSSSRLERFLQMCAENNIQVVNCTTPAQFFHLLRRQVKRNFRKPLVVMTPKSLLRHPLARSPWDDLEDGHFHEVMADPLADPNRVRRVVLCSGKLYYEFFYDAKEKDPQKRTREVPPDVAIVRLEQFYPFPEEQLRSVLTRYPRATEYIWSQEEPQNMGGWTFIEPRLRKMGIAVQYVGRDGSASPATGSYKIHDREQRELIEATLAHSGAFPYLVRAVPTPKPPAAPTPSAEQLAAKPGTPELPAPQLEPVSSDRR